MPPHKPKGFAKPKNTKKTLLRILSYMGKFKSLWILVFFFVFVRSFASVAGTYILKPAINDYIIPLIGQQNPDFSDSKRLLIKVMIIFACGVAATYINQRIMIFIGTRLLLNIRKDLFNKLEQLPVSFYDSHTHGELMSRFTNDTDALREMMSHLIPQLLSSVISVAAIFVMMIVLSPILTAVMIVTMALMMLLAGWIGKKSASSFRKNQKALGELNGYVEEMIEGQKVIKVFNYEDKAVERFEKLNEELCKAGTAANTFGGILGPLMNNLSHAQYAIVAVVSAFRVISGNMDLGTVAAFLQYTRSFSQPVSMMGQQAASLLNALAGAERIFAIIDEVPEVDEGKITLVNAYDARTSDGKFQLVQSFAKTGEWAWKNPSDGSLKRLTGEVVFDHVNFGYKAEKTILHDLCIHAKLGQKIAFVGSTGSGKTTTINLLTRFYDIPEGQGRILFDGFPINQISKASLRRSFGMVQQNTHLFTGTIRENIRYGNLDASDLQVYEAARLSNADSFIRHLEKGYDTVITGDGASLSQGQRQLLAIARAAVANPPVLILDEATSSIDTRTEALIEKGMDSLMKGRTTFVIAHRLSTVRNADEIIVLEHGKIIERGTHEQLIAKKGRYHFLYSGNLMDD
ncbi:MAG: ABC transporter ATP-binding protein/permease [Treponema sp.]|nr:ABC transporter ATP-binding protein/permease [Treponema sp.]